MADLEGGIEQLRTKSVPARVTEFLEAKEQKWKHAIIAVRKFSGYFGFICGVISGFITFDAWTASSYVKKATVIVLFGSWVIFGILCAGYHYMKLKKDNSQKVGEEAVAGSGSPGGGGGGSGGDDDNGGNGKGESLGRDYGGGSNTESSEGSGHGGNGAGKKPHGYKPATVTDAPVRRSEAPMRRSTGSSTPFRTGERAEGLHGHKKSQ